MSPKNSPEKGELNERENGLIKLPEDRTISEALKNKLYQYYEREHSLKSKIEGTQEYAESWQDTKYKIFLVKELLENGVVNISDAEQIFESEPGFNQRVFREACMVIQDYLKTGGKNVKGGSGFKK